MAQKRNSRNRPELLDAKLSELAGLIKDLSTRACVEISFAHYEDEDAHIRVYLPPDTEEEEIRRVELALGTRCNDILLDTGLFILGAVYDRSA
ncbi:MAG: hypothetical protein HY268_18145 [Deltaproteobacteria bacterium]|nr:hypothetical protein [Deltaproteobacteria bacterium]